MSTETHGSGTDLQVAVDVGRRPASGQSLLGVSRLYYAVSIAGVRRRISTCHIKYWLECSANRTVTANLLPLCSHGNFSVRLSVIYSCKPHGLSSSVHRSHKVCISCQCQSAVKRYIYTCMLWNCRPRRRSADQSRSVHARKVEMSRSSTRLLDWKH